MSEVRLIDANALKLMKVVECAGHTIEYAAGWKRCVEYCKNDAPTVDAVPVVHGEWIELPDKADRKYSHTCSACHRFHITEGEAEFYHYCPNCGAKMDGKEQIDG